MSKYVESLLTKQQELPIKEKNKGVLIQEIDEENAQNSEKLTADNLFIEEGKSESSSSNNAIQNTLKDEINEGPSMLELMMAAQMEAQNKIKNKAQSANNKGSTFADGFKKGFFAAKSSVRNSDKNEEIVTVSVSKQSADKKNPKSSVLQNVQHALKEEQMKAHEENEKKYGPLSQFLSSNEWVTPDLLSALQANEVLSAGLKDPKCLKAIQIVMSLSASGQTNSPKDVVDPILTDPSVAVFMKEFSKLMASHFEKLGDRSQSQSSPSTTVSQPVVTEIGPLHAHAIKNKKPSSSGKSPNSIDFTEKKDKSSVADGDDNKVQQILADPDLRSLLMDADLQRVLMECGDPVKFREHMRDPVIASKISRLQRAGLVGTTT